MSFVFKLKQAPHFWLYVSLVVAVLTEFVFVSVFQFIPLIEIACITLPILMYVNQNPYLTWNSPQSKPKGLELDPTPRRKEPLIEQSANIVKPLLKQLLLQDKGSIAQFEKNLLNQLFSQIEKADHEHLNLTATTSSGIEKYFITVDQVIKAVEAPQSRSGLKVFCWPIVSLPQHKRHFYSCEPGISLTGDMGFIKLSQLEARPSRGLIGVLHFLIFLRTVSLIRENLSICPRVPYIVDIPSSVLEYPKLVQYFFEYIDHPEFPIQSILWRLPETVLGTHSGGLIERIHERGGQFVCILSYPRTDLGWHYVQMNADTLHHIMFNQAYRQSQATLAQFAEQQSQVILGNVGPSHNMLESISTVFDYAFGSVFAKPEILENLTNTTNLFSSNAGALKIA